MRSEPEDIRQVRFLTMFRMAMTQLEELLTPLLLGSTYKEQVKSILGLICLFAIVGIAAHRAVADPSGIAVIRPNRNIQFAHAGWTLDRYPNLPTLDAGSRMVVADLKGPGVIRLIHSTRHASPAGEPANLFARGIVIEISYDGEETPSVVCPLADFFGDGCNGMSADFTSPFIECAPGAYNCYFPMPFRKRARVVLRNDTEHDALNYSFVEWERLPEWDERLGYFCATYRRDSYQMSPNTKVDLIEIEGEGHLVGRQMSWVCDHPVFTVGKDASMRYLMEGNNEISIDGQARVVDYLGTEDSFTFSWGFQKEFHGRRAGISYIHRQDPDDENFGEQCLSAYRFHDHLPIPFKQKLSWEINYEFEHGPERQWPGLKVMEDFGPDQGWVNLSSVFYWYQHTPVVKLHEPLAPVEDRLNNLWKTEH